MASLFLSFREKSDDVYVSLYTYRSLASLFKGLSDIKKLAVPTLLLLQNDLKVP